MKLDIAAGQNKREGFTGIDIMPGSDIVADLSVFPWPIEDGIVEEAHCSHFIEHTVDLLKFFDELYRIMKVGAQISIIAPYYSSIRCWQDPTHTRAISENTFLYANKGWREQNKLDHYPVKADFDFSYGYALDQAWQLRSAEATAFAIKHYINVVSDIHVTMTRRE